MELAYLVFTLACPLSMVALVGWWFWAMRRSNSSKPEQAPARSAAEEAEITRMRAQLDQLHAQARDQKAPSNG